MPDAVHQHRCCHYSDPIPILLVECRVTLLPSLAPLVNSPLSFGVFPQVFKTAFVTPLLKKPSLDPNEVQDYRPVSTLSFVSKIIDFFLLLSSLNVSLQTPYTVTFTPLVNSDTAPKLHC